MAATTLTIGNELLSSTMHIVMDDWRDNAHEKTAFLEVCERIHGAGQPKQNGGTRIVVPLGFGEHSGTTRLQTGYERIDLTVSDVFVPAVYDWGHVIRPVAISSEEEMVNSGEAAILSIVESRVKMTANALKREFVRQMVAGAEPGWEDWNTLNGLDNTGTLDGFLEALASGSQANVVGGVSKSTYSATPGWQNQFYDGGGSFNSNGLQALYDIKVEVQSVSSEDPNVILAGREPFKHLKRALQANERYIKEEALDGGRVSQTWDGIQIDVERNMPTAGSVSTADPVGFYFLNLNDIYPVWSDGGYFDLSDFETVSGEFDIRSAKIRVRGQLIAL
jgi:hypothetical protein